MRALLTLLVVLCGVVAASAQSSPPPPPPPPAAKPPPPRVIYVPENHGIPRPYRDERSYGPPPVSRGGPMERPEPLPPMLPRVGN